MTIYKMHPTLKKEIKAKFSPFSIDKDMVQVYELVMNGEILIGNSVQDACKKAFKAAMEIPAMYNKLATQVYSS
jgi:formylmethanofuran:tetrahydromethanopterin formyltransferase